MIAHVAIAVSDFDAAVASLEERGHKVNSTTLVEKPGLKAVWLMELDPLGNGVHIIWRQ
jgi:catechol 2,3-dioxygenase-like lactoylglutathione lyase family enzyme